MLSLSRLAPEKRIDQLIRAFGRVAAEHTEATLTIAGTGPEEGALKQQSARCGLESRVHFAGHVDPVRALAEHDVVVQLSVWENLSYTLLDAVAHGLGVVATDAGGSREIVPERCLLTAEDVPAVARAIVSQGQDLAARPSGGTTQSVTAMCAALADSYEEVTG